MKLLVIIDSEKSGLKTSDLNLLGFFEKKESLKVSAFALGEEPENLSNTPSALKQVFFHKDLQFYNPKGYASVLKFCHFNSDNENKRLFSLFNSLFKSAFFK